MRRLAQIPLRGKDVRHLSLDLSSASAARAPWHSPQQAALSHDYAVGDVLEVFAPNSDRAVLAFLRRFGLRPDDIVCIDPIPAAATGAGSAGESGWVLSAALRPGSEDTRGLPRRAAAWELATWYLDLAASPQRSFFDVLRECTDSPPERDRLEELTSLAWAAELDRYCARERRTLTEVLEDFPHAVLPLAAALELLPRLAPRSYSIASSSAFLRSPYASYLPPATEPAATAQPALQEANPLQPPSAFPAAPLAYPAVLPASAAAQRGLPRSLPEALRSRSLWTAAEAADAAAAGKTAPTAATEGSEWSPPPARADICVSIVEFRTPFKRLRRGHCTSFLAQAFHPSSATLAALPAAARRVWVRVKVGALGTVPLDKPLLGLGPGTGIAPLLALAQLRMRTTLGRLHALFAVEGLAEEDPEWAEEVTASLAPAALKQVSPASSSDSAAPTDASPTDAAPAAVVLGASSVSRPRLSVLLAPAPAGDAASLAEQLQQLSGLAPLNLLFGCQRAGGDHLYRDFFAAAVRLGAVDRYEACFSRDNGMGAASELTGELADEAVLRGDRYVQHRLTRGEVARAANQTVVDQGFIVIAGSAKKMPRDIRRALEALLAALNNCTEEEAGRMVGQMITQARYILDCWS